MHCVYRITNNINGMIYVGRTNNIKRRIKEYRCKSKSPHKKKAKFKIILEMYKYGFKNFTFDILEDDLAFEQSCDREAYWIKKLHAKDPNIGYNSKDGGIGGSLSKETHALIDYARETHMSLLDDGFIHLEFFDAKAVLDVQRDPIVAISEDMTDVAWFSSAKDAAKYFNVGHMSVTGAKNRGRTVRGYYIFSGIKSRQLRADKLIAKTDKRHEEGLTKDRSKKGYAKVRKYYDKCMKHSELMDCRD